MDLSCSYGNSGSLSSVLGWRLNLHLHSDRSRCSQMLSPLRHGRNKSLSLFLMTLTVLKGTGQVCCRMSLNWVLSDVFLIIRLQVLGFLRTITEVKCCFDHLSRVRIIHAHDLALLMLYSIATRLRNYVSGFSPRKGTPIPLPMSLEGSHSVQLILRRGVMLYSLEDRVDSNTRII